MYKLYTSLRLCSQRKEIELQLTCPLGVQSDVCGCRLQVGSFVLGQEVVTTLTLKKRNVMPAVTCVHRWSKLILSIFSPLVNLYMTNIQVFIDLYISVCDKLPGVCWAVPCRLRHMPDTWGNLSNYRCASCSMTEAKPRHTNNTKYRKYFHKLTVPVEYRLHQPGPPAVHKRSSRRRRRQRGGRPEPSGSRLAAVAWVCWRLQEAGCWTSGWESRWAFGWRSGQEKPTVAGRR